MDVSTVQMTVPCDKSMTALVLNDKVNPLTADRSRDPAINPSKEKVFLEKSLLWEPPQTDSDLSCFVRNSAIGPASSFVVEDCEKELTAELESTNNALREENLTLRRSEEMCRKEAIMALSETKIMMEEMAVEAREGDETNKMLQQTINSQELELEAKNAETKMLRDEIEKIKQRLNHRSSAWGAASHILDALNKSASGFDTESTSSQRGKDDLCDENTHSERDQFQSIGLPAALPVQSLSAEKTDFTSTHINVTEESLDVVEADPIPKENGTKTNVFYNGVDTTQSVIVREGNMVHRESFSERDETVQTEQNHLYQQRNQGEQVMNADLKSSEHNSESGVVKTIRAKGDALFVQEEEKETFCHEATNVEPTPQYVTEMEPAECSEGKDVEVCSLKMSHNMVEKFASGVTAKKNNLLALKDRVRKSEAALRQKLGEEVLRNKDRPSLAIVQWDRGLEFEALQQVISESNTRVMLLEDGISTMKKSLSEKERGEEALTQYLHESVTLLKSLQQHVETVEKEKDQLQGELDISQRCGDVAQFYRAIADTEYDEPWRQTVSVQRYRDMKDKAIDQADSLTDELSLQNSVDSLSPGQ